jgi:hypothetical protein
MPYYDLAMYFVTSLLQSQGHITWDNGYKMTTPSYCMDTDYTEPATQINGNFQISIYPENCQSSSPD